MRKYIYMLVGLLVGLAMSATTAFAAGVFDSSTPPTSAPWMTRPCIHNPTDAPRLQNCYWNNTMGLTDAAGNHIDAGFWIYKLPHQPLVCYIYSPDDYTWAQGRPDEKCYSTTSNRAAFDRRVFDLNN